MKTNITKELGKISSVTFGMTGYQDAGFGMRFNFSGKSWGVSDDTHWVWNTEPDKSTKWTHKDRLEQMGKIMDFVRVKMNEANINNFKDFVGVPVEVTFEDRMIKSWRILGEVL